MDGGRSRSSQEEDEARRASKQLKTVHQGQEKEVTTQSEPQAWLPIPMLYGEPLMDITSLRDFYKGEGAFVADVSERSLLLPAVMVELGGFEEARGLPQHQKVLGHGKTSNTCGSIDFCSLVFNSPYACFNWQAVQATYRLEKAANDQGRALELECDKRLDARRHLKTSRPIS